MLYYAKIDGKVIGPMSHGELLSLRKKGTLHDRAHWTSDGCEIWSPAPTLESTPGPSLSVRTEWLGDLGKWFLGRMARNFAFYLLILIFLSLIAAAARSLTQQHQQESQSTPAASTQSLP